MRLAFCGKGGSGKSTVSSLFARYLAHENLPVLVIDGDINQHLGLALGFDEGQLQAQRKMGMQPDTLHTYIRGKNPRIPSIQVISENTPPGTGSNLVYFNETNPVAEAYEIQANGIRFIALGGHADEQLGATCYHTFTHKMGTYLNHLIDGDGEYVLTDMCAGADPFATALAAKVDAVCLIVEPTEKSVGVYDQCRAYAEPYGTRIFVIGNKIEDRDDLAYIKSHVGDALIGQLSRSDFVRRQEKGQWQGIAALEPDNLELMRTIRTLADCLTRDWDKYQRNNAIFHGRAAVNWANVSFGMDMMTQIDPDFRYADYIHPKKKAA